MVPKDGVQDLIVDGGYVDNFGAYALADILDHVRLFDCKLSRRALRYDPNQPLDITGCEAFQRAPTQPGIVPVVIQITSDPDLIRSSMGACTCSDTPSAWRLEPPGEKTRSDISAFTEVLGPAIAMDQMRQRNGIVFASALAARADVAAYFHFGLGAPYPADGQLHRREPPPSLNWTLSQHSMQQIDEYLAQCDHLETRALVSLMREPARAAEMTRDRIRQEYARVAHIKIEDRDPLCRR